MAKLRFQDFLCLPFWADFARKNKRDPNINFIQPSCFFVGVWISYLFTTKIPIQQQQQHDTLQHITTILLNHILNTFVNMKIVFGFVLFVLLPTLLYARMYFVACKVIALCCCCCFCCAGAFCYAFVVAFDCCFVDTWPLLSLLILVHLCCVVFCVCVCCCLLCSLHCCCL